MGVRTSIFEWYVVNCGFENGRHNGMCLEEVGLRRAQNMLTILGSTINVFDWEDGHDHLMNMRTFTLILNKIII